MIHDLLTYLLAYLLTYLRVINDLFSGL